jgi:hypothetical protein
LCGTDSKWGQSQLQNKRRYNCTRKDIKKLYNTYIPHCDPQTKRRVKPLKPWRSYQGFYLGEFELLFLEIHTQDLHPIEETTLLQSMALNIDLT